jgi:hypothetical protein
MVGQVSGWLELIRSGFRKPFILVELSHLTVVVEIFPAIAKTVAL